MEGSKSLPEDDGHFASTFESAQSCHIADAQTHSKQTTTPSKPKRSFTPRGPIFSSLNDAHRNITSRHIGANEPSKVSDQNDLSDDRDESDKSQSNSHNQPGDWDNAASLPAAFGRPIINPKHHLPDEASTFLLPSSPAGRSLTFSTPSCTTPTMPSNAKPSGNQITGQVEVFEREVSRVDHAADQAEREVNRVVCEVNSVDDKVEKTETLPPSASVSTVDKIFDEYTTGDREAQPSTLVEGHLYTFQGANLARAASPSEPPKRRLPSFPRVDAQLAPSTELLDGDLAAPEPSISDSQHLIDAEAQVDQLRGVHHSLAPLPLRIPSRREFKSPDFFTDVESSINGEHDDTSNEDPFKYDSERYQNFLRPAKERDVSRALKRLSRLEQASEGTLVSPEGSPNAKAAASERPTINSKQSRDAAARFLRDKPNGRFINPSPLQSAGDTEPRNVKVVIHHAPEFEPDEKGHQHKATERSKKHLNVGCTGGKSFPRDATSDSGWVTEATSDIGSAADVGSDCPFPATGFKQAGSSIADYSDDDDDIDHNRGPFTSRQHILHQPRSGAQVNSYERRNLKDRKQLIFLPKTRGHEVNGFPQNSIRLFSTRTVKHTDAGGRRPSTIRQLSNPFGQGSYRRAAADSNFQFKPRGNGASKYEFRDSASEYTPVMESNQATCGTTTSPPSRAASKRRTGSGITVGLTIDTTERGVEVEGGQNRAPLQRFGPLQNAQRMQKSAREAKFVDETLPPNYLYRRPRNMELDKQFAMGTPGSFGHEPTSACSFGFELLPLDEAQAKLKRQRDSGETDETEPASVRFKRVRSVASGQACSNSSPLQPPTAARLRRDQHQNTVESLSSLSWYLKTVPQDPTTPRTAMQQDDLISPTSDRSLLGGSNGLQSPLTPATDYGLFSPTMSTHGWYGKNGSERWLLDRRAQGDAVRQMSHKAMNSGSEPSYRAGVGRISSKTRVRYICWFAIMAVLSILPFFALLVLTGVFDDSLAWVTRGEVRYLAPRERKIIKTLFAVECVFYAGAIAGIIAYFVLHSKTSN
ncbi:hypothetical protein DL766_004256 [Monosporascus sp. MC13-8B]|nr:hypothetical protein DL763_003695 [Monosporascus cannonballus]RYP31777.1 hypothetical protein DL766_004256 [Monosporascus sp. MC13-8B]